MNESFVRLLNLSVAGGILVAVVILLRLFLRKAPKWMICLLWAIVAVRLVCPFSIPTRFSAYNLIGEYGQTEYFQYNGKTEKPMIEVSLSASAEESSLGQAPAPDLSLAAKVWGCGFVGMLGYAVWSYLRLKKKVKASLLLRKRIFACDEVATPFILGIFRPRIYVPSSLEGVPLHYVVAHEKMHLRRLDHCWKPAGYLLLAIHWFNPLIWLGYILLCRDIELACDEAVIRDMDGKRRAAYSQTLLDCSLPRRSIAACPLAFGGVGVKERVKSVLHHKKPAIWLVLLAVVACIAVAVCFLTGPKTKNPYEWTSNVRVEDITSAVRWDTGYALNDVEKEELVQLLHTLPENCFSPNPSNAGITPPYGLELTYAEKSCRINEADGRLELNWKGEAWWVDNAKLYSFLTTLGDPQKPLHYYLTVGKEGVNLIQVRLPEAEDGYIRPSGDEFSVGEQVELLQLEGIENAAGGQIIAYDGNGEIIFLCSIPEEIKVGNVFATEGWALYATDREEALPPLAQEPDLTSAEETVRMVRVGGICYLDTGNPSTVTARCGTPDGYITSTVPEDQTPTEDDQSNFGVGYEYQLGGDGIIEVRLDDGYRVFAAALCSGVEKKTAPPMYGE